MSPSPSDGRCAVVGASGFIGREIVHAMRRRGHNIVRIGRSADEQDLIVDDLTNYERLADVFRQNGVDRVCDCAWVGHPRSAGHDYRGQFDQNVVTATNLAIASGLAGVEHLLFVSSGGGAAAAIQRQGLPPAYGWAKSTAEGIVAAGARSFDYRFTSLRPTAVYGPRQDPTRLLGVVAVFASQILTGQELTVIGSLEASRDFLHVRDLAELVATCFEKHVAGVYDVGGPELVSLRSLLTELGRTTGIEPVVNVVDQTAVDPLIVQLDNERIAAATGWSPTRRIVDELPELVAEMLARSAR
jgi:UDP-glucose 4-epimerase